MKVKRRERSHTQNKQQQQCFGTDKYENISAINANSVSHHIQTISTTNRADITEKRVKFLLIERLLGLKMLVK